MRLFFRMRTVDDPDEATYGEKDARLVGLNPAKAAAGVARAAFLVVWMGAWFAPTLGVAQDRSAA